MPTPQRGEGMPPVARHRLRSNVNELLQCDYVRRLVINQDGIDILCGAF